MDDSSICKAAVGAKLAVDRRFGRHGGAKVALDRRFSWPYGTKLALKRCIGCPGSKKGKTVK